MIYDRHFYERIPVTSNENTLGRLTAHAHILICQCVEVRPLNLLRRYSRQHGGEGRDSWVYHKRTFIREKLILLPVPLTAWDSSWEQGRVSLWQSTATPAQQAWKRHIVQISHLGGGEGDSGSFQRTVQPKNDRKRGNYYNFWFLSRIHLKLLSMPTGSQRQEPTNLGKYSQSDKQSKAGEEEWLHC